MSRDSKGAQARAAKTSALPQGFVPTERNVSAGVLELPSGINLAVVTFRANDGHIFKAMIKQIFGPIPITEAEHASVFNDCLEWDEAAPDMLDAIRKRLDRKDRE